jgi:hypothetical protein
MLARITIKTSGALSRPLIVALSAPAAYDDIALVFNGAIA